MIDSPIATALVIGALACGAVWLINTVLPRHRRWLDESENENAGCMFFLLFLIASFFTGD